MKIVQTIRGALGAAGDFFTRYSRNPNTLNRSLLETIYSSEYRKTRSYNDYRKMLRDPQVKVGYQALVQFLLSRELTFTSASDSDIDKQARDFIEKAFKTTKTPMRSIRKDIYTALPYGFSAMEIVYMVGSDGKIVIEDFYPIHRKTLDHRDAFVFDDRGNLAGLRQRINYGLQETIPIEKILLYSYDSEFNSPWGNSILEELYDTVFIKNQVLKWLAVYLQKHESPTLVGKVSNNKHKDKLREQLEEVTEGRTNLTVGADDTVEVLESSHRGEGFFNAIRYHDDVIFRRFFIGTLLFGQASGGGAYAQSQTQFDITKIIMDGIHNDIAIPFQSQADYLTKLNFTGAQAPIVGFQPFEEKDILKLMEILKPYIDNLTIDPEAEWFRELIAEVVDRLSGVKVDLETINPPGDDGLENASTMPGAEDSPLKTELENLLPTSG